jgi:hypothetical protein
MKESNRSKIEVSRWVLHDNIEVYRWEMKGYSTRRKASLERPVDFVVKTGKRK